MAIRLVVFDLGGVIVRHCRTWAEGCAAAGLPLEDAAGGIPGESGGAPEAAARRRELTGLLTRGLIHERDFYALMAATTGGRYGPGEIERIHHAWTQGEYDGVRGIVEPLLDAVPVGVLSNTTAPHWRLLADPRRYPTVSLLLTGGRGRGRGRGRGADGAGNPHAHASHLLGLAKPDPAIFAEYQKRTGVAAAEILFFEDLPDNIAAARAAGWHVEPIDWQCETAGQIARALERHGLA